MAENPSSRDDTPVPRSPLVEGSLLGLHAARLWCDTCGRTTVHRILHWNRLKGSDTETRAGVARCRECGGTHPFDVAKRSEGTFDLIISRGAVSERRRVARPASERLAVSSRVPGIEPALSIRRIVRHDQASAGEATVAEIASVWAVPEDEVRLKVSIVEGPRTRPAEWVVPPDTALAVDETFRLEGGSVRIVGLRAQGRTWRLPDVRFPAREVQRVYGRWTAIPPAGRRVWSRGRGIPRSRTSSFSRSDRSRSSPGVRRARTSPRRRTAPAGATVHRVSPS
jgi:uncharacterized Zn finger protein